MEKMKEEYINLKLSNASLIFKMKQKDNNSGAS